MSNVQILYIGNDTVLELESLRNELTGAYLNDATVTVTLEDTDGVDVAGDTWPVTMAHVASSDGLYRATLKYTLSLVEGRKYRAQITADAGAGLRAAWQVDCVARKRA
jgi:hypothetical protein